MNNHRNQTTIPYQQLIVAEPAALSINSPLPPPELEIRFDELMPEQQVMVEQSLNHHLAMVLAEKKTRRAAEGIIRFSVQIGELYVEANFQLDRIEARAHGRPHQERVNRFLDKRKGRVEQYLETLEDQLATRLTIEAGKSIYPKPKIKDDRFSLFNIRLFTSETTEIHQASEQEERLPMATGTLFGTGIE